MHALFNAAFHAVTTVTYREYSPGLVTSLLAVPLWRRLTGAALTERRLTRPEVAACVAVAGVVHLAVVARQVFFIGAAESAQRDLGAARPAAAGG